MFVADGVIPWVQTLGWDEPLPCNAYVQHSSYPEEGSNYAKWTTMYMDVTSHITTNRGASCEIDTE